MRKTLLIGLVVLSSILGISFVRANVLTQQETTTERSSYEPMRVFEALAGKTMRGSWIGDDGAEIVDIATSRMILGGRAYQGTHKLENSTYGGRTIIFYDEGKKEYIFHYFTTAGFHTTGTLDVTENGYSATETVSGHPTIIAVRSTLTIEGDRHLIAVKYQSKEGEWTDAAPRIYEPYAGAAPSFDTPENQEVNP